MIQEHLVRASDKKKTNTAILLTVIIPLRTNDNIDVIERLSWKHIPVRGDVEVLIVDDGSRNAKDIKNFTKSRGWRYLFLNTQDAPFSLSRARNAGIRGAQGEYIYFEDVDFLHRSDFYDAMLDLTISFDEVPFNFASVPTLFLNQDASNGLIAKIESREDFDRLFNTYIQKLQFLNPDQPNELCDSYALMGSNILVKRDVCFHVGLYDEFFNGWGGEDRDFIYRLMAHNSKLLRPQSFAATKNWKPHRTNAYEGWRAAYRLHGDWLKCLGIYSLHIHHPENAWKDPDVRRFNFEYAERKAVEIEAGKRKVDPLPLPEAEGVELNIFVGRNPVFFNDQVMGVLRNVKVVDPLQTIPAETFAADIITDRPSRVFFQNPYGNPWLNQVWALVRGAGIKCICAERGALPWSIYFDDGGFCNDSKSYDNVNWQASEPVNAAEYIAELRTRSQYLEPQGTQKVDVLKNQIDPEKKTILVLLQSLTDTTTKYFCDPLKNYNDFLDLIRSLNALGDFNLLVKNHPLNKVNPLLGVGINVDNCLIYDLFDVCDVALTLNSGAGLLALGSGKPVINAGTSYYAKDGLAENRSTLGSILEFINDDKKPDVEAVNRFFGFLINDFYSFASWDYDSRDAGDKTRLSLMKNINFQKIKIGELSKNIRNTKLDQYSLIMDPFAHHTFVQKQKLGDIKPSPAKVTPPVKKQEPKVVATPKKVVEKPKIADNPQPLTVIPSEPFKEVVKEKRDDEQSVEVSIKRPSLFWLYKIAYNPFLATKQKDRLKNDPVEFLEKANHPMSRLGKSLFLK